MTLFDNFERCYVVAMFLFHLQTFPTRHALQILDYSWKTQLSEYLLFMLRNIAELGSFRNCSSHLALFCLFADEYPYEMNDFLIANFFVYYIYFFKLLSNEWLSFFTCKICCVLPFLFKGYFKMSNVWLFMTIF